jgi:hypothetical protein
MIVPDGDEEKMHSRPPDCKLSHAIYVDVSMLVKTVSLICIKAYYYLHVRSFVLAIASSLTVLTMDAIIALGDNVREL